MDANSLQSTIVWLNVQVIRKYAFFAAIIGSIGNLFVIYITLKNKEFHKNFHNWLILYLAIADSIQSLDLIEALIHATYFIGDPPYNRVLCAIMAAPQFFGIFFAEVIILFMATDRLIAITFPISYRVFLTGKSNIRATWTFLLAMVFCFVPFVLYFWGMGFGDIIYLCNGVVAANPAFRYYYAVFLAINAYIVVVLYMFIIYGIKKASRKLDGDVQKQMLRTQQKVFKRTSDFLIAFMILWGIPSTTLMLGTFFISDSTFGALSSGTFICGSCTNSIINVWINLKKNEEAREILMKILPKQILLKMSYIIQSELQASKTGQTSSVSPSIGGSSRINLTQTSSVVVNKKNNYVY